MLLSCSTLVCPKETYPQLADALERIAKLGFKAIDLSCLGPWHGIDTVEVVERGDAYVSEIAAQVAEAGLRVSSLNTDAIRGIGYGITDELERARAKTEAMIALAKAVDCPNITSQVIVSRSETAETRAAQLANYREYLLQYGRMVAGAGLSFSIEGHEGSCLERPEVLLPLLEELSPAVQLAYDPSHLGALDIDVSDAPQLLDYAVHCHVRNALPGALQADYDRGIVDFNWVIAALGERGYPGALAIEYFGPFSTDENILALRDKLVSLGVQLEP
jgi:sugar phosphate isomerase/epimerase